MDYLLDTQSLLWAGSNPDRLSSRARETISDAANRGRFSPVSPWELAIKSGLGKLPSVTDLDGLVRRVIRDLDLRILDISVEHGLYVATLPVFADHKDPFDRLLIAQALIDNLPVVSSDKKFARYGVEVIW